MKYAVPKKADVISLIDTFENDPNYGCYFDDGDMDGIVAWMPLPQPYNGESED